MWLSVCPSVTVCIHPSIHSFIHSFICPSIHPSTHPSIHLDTHSTPDFTLLTTQTKQSDQFTRRGDSWWGFSHPPFFLLSCPNFLPSTISPLRSPSTPSLPPGELEERKWDGSWGLERGVNCLVTAWVQGQMKALALSKVQGSPRSKLMDSLTCRGWNQLKYIKSRIHAFSEWQIYAGNWERRREKNVFDLLETGCSFCQGSQA